MSDSFYEIKPLDTKKDLIKQPECVKNKVLPKHPFSVIINGKSGSGKSILTQNIIFDERFYGKYFDEIYLVSPTAKSDDIQKQFNIPETNIFDDLIQAPEQIQNILDFQRENIEKHGIDKSLKICFIFDDCISDKKFMAKEILTKLFISCRHYGASVVLCSQSWTQTQRRCRLQSHMICIFPSSQSEVDLLCDEFTPNGYNKKDFQRVVEFATDKPYNFLTIITTYPQKIRYRKNLNDVINL